MGRGPANGNAPGWFIFETTSPASRPSLVYELGDLREMAERRRSWLNGGKLEGTFDRIIRKVQRTGEPTSDSANLPNKLDEDKKLFFDAEPVLGPNGEVYGVEIAVGQDPDPKTQFPRRLVRGYSYNVSEQMHHHGPGVDEDILRIDPLAAVRPPQNQIFNLYDDFPRMGELEQFIEAIQAGQHESGAKLQVEICLTDGLGQGRTIQASQRLIFDTDGNAHLKGILHDVTDIPGHEHRVDPSKQLAQFLAAQSDSAVGLGNIGLTSGTLTSWIKPPPAPLDVWQLENPVLSDRAVRLERTIRRRVLDGESSYIEFQTELHFPKHGVRSTAIIGYKNVGQHQGIITTRFVT